MRLFTVIASAIATMALAAALVVFAHIPSAAAAESDSPVYFDGSISIECRDSPAQATIAGTVKAHATESVHGPLTVTIRIDGTPVGTPVSHDGARDQTRINERVAFPSPTSRRVEIVASSSQQSWVLRAATTTCDANPAAIADPTLSIHTTGCIDTDGTGPSLTLTARSNAGASQTFRVIANGEETGAVVTIAARGQVRVDSDALQMTLQTGRNEVYLFSEDNSVQAGATATISACKQAVPGTPAPTTSHPHLQFSATVEACSARTGAPEITVAITGTVSGETYTITSRGLPWHPVQATGTVTTVRSDDQHFAVAPGRTTLTLSAPSLPRTLSTRVTVPSCGSADTASGSSPARGDTNIPDATAPTSLAASGTLPPAYAGATDFIGTPQSGESGNAWHGAIAAALITAATVLAHVARRARTR